MKPTFTQREDKTSFRCGCIYGTQNKQYKNSFDIFYENGVYLGEFYIESGGEYVLEFNPKRPRGYVNESILFSLATALEELNKPYREELDRYFEEDKKKRPELYDGTYNWGAPL